MARISRSASAKHAEQAASVCKAGPNQSSSSCKKTASIKITNPLKPPMASVRVTRSMSKSASPPLEPPPPESDCLQGDTQRSTKQKILLPIAQYVSIQVPKRITRTLIQKTTRQNDHATLANTPPKSVHFASDAVSSSSKNICTPTPTSSIHPTSANIENTPPLQAVTAYSCRSPRSASSSPSSSLPSKTVRSVAKEAIQSVPMQPSTRPTPAHRKRAAPVVRTPANSEAEETDDEDHDDNDDDCVVAVSSSCTAASVRNSGRSSLLSHASATTPLEASMTAPKRSGISLTNPLRPVFVSPSRTRTPSSYTTTAQARDISKNPSTTQPTSPRKARKARRRARSASADPNDDAVAQASSRSISPEAVTRQQSEVQFSATSSSSKEARPKKALPTRRITSEIPSALEVEPALCGTRVTRSRSISTAARENTVGTTCAQYDVAPSSRASSSRRSSRKRKASRVVDYAEDDDEETPKKDLSIEYAESDAGSDSDSSSTSEPRKRQRRKRRSTSKGPSSGRVELLCPSRIRKAISDIFKAPKFLRWNPHLSQKQLGGLKNPDGPEWPEDDPVFHPFVSPKKELGHGQKRIDGVKYSMHRLSFAAHNGTINSKMDVSHVMDCGIGLSGRNINPYHLTQESNDDNQVRKGHHRIMQLHAQNTTDSCFGLHIETRCRKWDKSRVSAEAQKQLDELVQEELRKMKPAKGK